MTTKEKMTAKTKSVKRVFDGFFKLDEYTIETDKHDGSKMELQRLVLERGNSVAILPYDPGRDEILLINAFSPGAYAANDEYFCNTLPAGGVWRT